MVKGFIPLCNVYGDVIFCRLNDFDPLDINIKKLYNSFNFSRKSKEGIHFGYDKLNDTFWFFYPIKRKPIRVEICKENVALTFHPDIQYKLVCEKITNLLQNFIK